MQTGMAKLFASEVALRASLESMRIHGSYGYSTELDIERLYRDAPLMAIGEGTNDILRTVIAKGLLAVDSVRHRLVGTGRDAEHGQGEGVGLVVIVDLDPCSDGGTGGVLGADAGDDPASFVEVGQCDCVGDVGGKGW